MNILIVGGGGREHALAWKISQSPRADRVFVAPGNAGTAVDAENVDISDGDIPALLEFAKQNKVELAVIGPEAPLAAGIVDVFEEEKIRVFGPSRAAAELEASKVFCKNLLRGADVPSADFRTFDNVDDALKYIRDRENTPVVVKADGLAAGKGVIVCSGQGEAVAAVKMIGADKAFGEAGNRLVIEERLVGQEVSVLAITDGRTIFTLQPAQDHKPAHDGDTGPNTGGMGAYCPTPAIDEATLYWVEEHVLVPTVHAMKLDGRDFRGVLYAGLMMTPQGPKVLEYNVRFGDPECQPLLMRLKTDLLDVIEATVDGRLSEIDPADWDPRPAVCVVMASEGYPGGYEKGRVITGLEEADALPDVKVFHAGTKLNAGQTITSGGRVLGVTALGDTIAQAKLQAYKAVKCIRWKGAWCRTDIADKAIG
ncbi:MAG: phosphoribosylamine--glycine ligase [Pirellulales bacterium]|nr:phosphoribosylamine--glycine ligase [Pirellulales bacterium]